MGSSVTKSSFDEITDIFVMKLDNSGNIILVTHYVVIMELLNISSESGEIIISNKNYEVISRKTIK